MDRIVFLIAALFLMFSCNRMPENREINAESFMKYKDDGLVKGRKYLFRYNPATCQTVNNNGRNLLRMQSDDQSSYVNAVFSQNAFQMQQNGYVGVILTYRLEKEGDPVTEIFEMEILKNEQTKVWLWNKEMNLGLIVSTK
jgi:hypothetical protein